MLKLSRIPLYILMTFCLATLLYVPVSSVTAQAASQETDNSKGIDFYSEVEFEHSDNVFHLTDSQESKLEANAIEDSESGRFKDMESVSDNIVSPTLGMKYDFKGLGGEDLNLSVRARYNYYMDNQEKSYPEARIRLKNDIGKKGALVLEGNFLSDFFKKNYLSDYNDEDGNGNIPRGERIYSPAVYDEYEGILSYEYELFKDNDKTLTQVDLKPFLGYSTRSYNSTFDNRGRHVASVGMEAIFEFRSRIDLEFVYQYENACYPGDEELVLFDETRFETDVNGDGDIKSNAPLVANIDRSADRHIFAINPSFKISKDTLLFLGYERRTSYYTSDNPLDIDHYNNTSHRQKIKAGIQYDVSKSWSTEFEYRCIDDEDPEDGDFFENSFTLSIRYDFP